MKIFVFIALLIGVNAVVENSKPPARPMARSRGAPLRRASAGATLQKGKAAPAAAHEATQSSALRGSPGSMRQMADLLGPEDIKAAEPYLLTVDSLKNKFNRIYNFYLPLPESLYPHRHSNIGPTTPLLSPECERDVTAIYESFQGILLDSRGDEEKLPPIEVKLKPWAMKLMDSWGKTEDGVMEANIRYLGYIDECLETVGNVTDEATGQSTTFDGQYCLVTTRPPQQVVGTGLLPLQYASCIPSSCTEKEFERSLADQTAAIGYDNATVGCQQKDHSPDSNAWAIVGSVVILVMILPVAASSVLHPFAVKVPAVLKAFAIQRSWTALADVTRPSRRELSAVYGIRVLSISWVIMGHYYNSIPLLVDNPLMVPSITDQWTFQMVWGSTYAVETFFMLSGLLTTIIIMKTNFLVERRENFIEDGKETPDRTSETRFRSPDASRILREIKSQGPKKTLVVFFRTYAVYIARRLIWLVPALLLVAMYCAGPSAFFIRGPFRRAYERIYLTHCRQNWWVDLTFISNFLSDHSSCIPSSWFIATDFQLFLVAPCFLLPLKVVRWKYVYAFSLVMVFSIIRGTISLSYELIPINLLDESGEESEAYEKYVRNMPWARASSFFVGSFCALLLLEVETARQAGTVSRVRWLKLIRNKTVAAVGWVVATATALGIIFGIVNRNYFHTGPTHSYNYAEIFFYSSFTATAWAACISWIILLTHSGRGNGGPVGSLLTHPIWTLPSRFTYSVYVISYPLELMMYYSIHRLFFVSDLSFLLTYSGISVICFMVGIFVCLVAEAPYVAVSKLLLPRMKFM